jgi:predicted DNA-binding mobile mystery protein A
MDRKKAFDELRLYQLDERLDKIRAAGMQPSPSPGWIRTIRSTLGMTATSLAGRLNMTAEGVRKIEKAEAEERITLATLIKVADALDCDFRYALIPRTSLTQQLNDRARELAGRELAPVAHTMSLEDQAVKGKAQEAQLTIWSKMLLNGPRRNFW